MKATELFKELQSFCAENADDAIVKKYARYFKENYNAYGISTPLMREKIKEISGRKDIDLTLILDAAPLLMKSGKYEETAFLLHLLNARHKQFTKDTFHTVGSWFATGIHNWAHADTLGMMILPGFIKSGIVTTEDFKPWIYSQYKFQRRCVPVTLIKSLKESKNYSSFFALTEPLMTDPEREVHQGQGWFLREAWKIRSTETEKFMMKYKDISPRLIFQYACEKMTAAEKLRFKKSK